ncbi:MAG: BatD family protein [Verrucomicrobiota bacterium]|jgi:hypothetical protein
MLELWRQTLRAGRRKLPDFRLAAALAALCLGLAPALAGAATFTASLDRDTITLGESVTLALTFQGGAPPEAPSPPDIANLRLAYVGPSSQFTVVNGVVSSTVTHNFTVTPLQAGDFTIPSLAAQVDGARLSTQPLKLKVLKPGAPSPEAINSGAQAAFLKLVLPQHEVYLGQTLVAELQLYVRDGVGLSRSQLTAFPAEGFNLGQLQAGTPRGVRIGPAVYRVSPYEFTLKPVKTGSLSLGPVTVNALLELPSRDGRRDPFFEQFGLRSLFSSGEQKQVVLATETTNLLSLPLPSQDVPPNFSGAVGNFTMTVTAGPTNVMAGDPITVRVQIAGRGALDALVWPDQPAWRDFKTYPPTAKPLEPADRFGLQGAKTFEQIVVPQNPEVKELPPISFSFFDPDRKTYRTLTQPAVPLLVRPGGSVPAPTIVAAGRAAQDLPPPAQDIVHIKPRLGALAQVGPPLLAHPWFLALQAVPVLAWASTLAWRKRAQRLANNPRLRRRRQVAQTIRDGLRELRSQAAGNQSDEFFATLFRLLQEQLGERLDLPASAITEAVIEEHLRPRGAPESVLAQVQELFQTCNLARYAPVRTSQELTALIPKFEAARRELQTLDT